MHAYRSSQPVFGSLLYRSIRRGLALLLVALAGCSFFSGLQNPAVKRDSAPAVSLDANRIADAEPRVEARSRGGNRSVYTVFGKSYRVLENADGYRERGDASWYGKKFHGRPTANGERYDMYKMTAAHKHLPIPSYVRVKNLENGREIIVRVNDRGPFHGNRIIDLSYAAATKIGMLRNGTAKVEIEVIDAKAWQMARRSETSRLASRGSGRPAAPLSKASAPASAPAPAAAVAALPKTPPAPVTAGSSVASAGAIPAAGGARHYVQVAAFSSLESAQGVQNALLERLNRGEIPATARNVVIHPRDEGALYRVRIGPLASQALARKLIEHPLLASYDAMHSILE